MHFNTDFLHGFTRIGNGFTRILSVRIRSFIRAYP